MNQVLKVTKLQINKRDVTFLVPVSIIGMVAIVSAIISIALQRAGLESSDPDFAAGARNNLGIVWALPGFLVYYGVQAVSTTFPFALALGATRRAYVMGTLLANILTSAYVTVIMTILLWIELASGHWCFNIYILDNYALGSGKFSVLIPVVFLGVLFCTSVGGLFAAVWVRFGSKGPTLLGLGLGLALATAILIFVPYFEQIFAGITGPRLALAGVIVIVVTVIGTWVSMLRAAVR